MLIWLWIGCAQTEIWLVVNRRVSVWWAAILLIWICLLIDMSDCRLVKTPHKQLSTRVLLNFAHIGHQYHVVSVSTNQLGIQWYMLVLKTKCFDSFDFGWEMTIRRPFYPWLVVWSDWGQHWWGKVLLFPLVPTFFKLDLRRSTIVRTCVLFLFLLSNTLEAHSCLNYYYLLM